MTDYDGKFLKQIRIEHKLTQEEIAFQLIYSRQNISKWEHNKSEVRNGDLMKLATIYQVDADLFKKRYHREITDEEFTNAQTNQKPEDNEAAITEADDRDERDSPSECLSINSDIYGKYPETKVKYRWKTNHPILWTGIIAFFSTLCILILTIGISIAIYRSCDEHGNAIIRLRLNDIIIFFGILSSVTFIFMLIKFIFYKKRRKQQ